MTEDGLILESLGHYDKAGRATDCDWRPLLGLVS